MAKKKTNTGETAATPPVKELTLGDLIREAVLRGGVDRKSNAGIAEYIRRVHPNYKFADTSIASTKAKALAEAPERSAPASPAPATPAKRPGRPSKATAPARTSVQDKEPTSGELLALHALVGTDLQGATQTVARVKEMLEKVSNGNPRQVLAHLERSLEVLRHLSGGKEESK